MDKERFNRKTLSALGGVYLNMLANQAMHWETTAVEWAMDAIRGRPVEEPAETVDALSRILENGCWVATKEERLAIQVGIHKVTWQGVLDAPSRGRPWDARFSSALPEETDQAA